MVARDAKTLVGRERPARRGGGHGPRQKQNRCRASPRIRDRTQRGRRSSGVQAENRWSQLLIGWTDRCFARRLGSTMNRSGLNPITPLSPWSRSEPVVNPRTARPHNRSPMSVPAACSPHPRARTARDAKHRVDLQVRGEQWHRPAPRESRRGGNRRAHATPVFHPAIRVRPGSRPPHPV
jgi:hypothetical protein